MKSEVMDSDFKQYFQRYCNDSMLLSVLKDVRKQFLAMANTPTVNGVPYVVLCLLLAQAMESMLDGYNGAKSSSSSLLHEAVAISVFYSRVPISFHSPLRYMVLVKTVNELQRNNIEFAKLVNNFLEWDKLNTEPLKG